MSRQHALPATFMLPAIRSLRPLFRVYSEAHEASSIEIAEGRDKVGL